jgi:hypothetical protein
MIKKIVARAWLYVLGFVIAGLVMLPWPLMLILDPQEGVSVFYEALLGGRSVADRVVDCPRTFPCVSTYSVGSLGSAGVTRVGGYRDAKMGHVHRH